MADSIYDQLRSTLKHLRYTLYFGVVVITLIAFGGLLQPYLLSEYINYTFYPMLTMLMIVVFRSTIKAMTLSIRAYGDTIFDEHRKTVLQGFMELACFSKVLDSH
ncbi:hypothetical protein [Photobacterium leiognathi]|uniref:hypothetical protein n=1 Tax=Photobacterium leiognathi TaxID=553611 RepID=UPI00273862D0|nr:hypothetical protein [Photobacterium leiognathi]